MPAPRPEPGFWCGVAVAVALSLPLWAGIIWTVRQVLP